MRLQVNASSVTGDEPSGGYSDEYKAQCVVRKEPDGTLTVIELEDFKPTSRTEREHIKAGCLGCMYCE